MTDKEYLDRAIIFIVELVDGDPAPICDLLTSIPEEAEICAEDCQNLDHFCVLRYLKHYKKEE